jgi:hypothetical protein
MIADYYTLVPLEDDSGEHPYLVALRRLLGPTFVGRLGIKDGDYTLAEGARLAKKARVRLILCEGGRPAEVWDYRTPINRPGPSLSSFAPRSDDLTMRIFYDGRFMYEMRQREIDFTGLVKDVQDLILSLCAPFDLRMLMLTCKKMALLVGKTGRQWDVTHPIHCTAVMDDHRTGEWNVWPATDTAILTERHHEARWVLPYTLSDAALAWDYLVWLYDRRRLPSVRALIAPPAPCHGVVYFIAVAVRSGADAAIQELRKNVVYPPCAQVKLKAPGKADQRFDW